MPNKKKNLLLDDDSDHNSSQDSSYQADLNKSMRYFTQIYDFQLNKEDFHTGY